MGNANNACRDEVEVFYSLTTLQRLDGRTALLAVFNLVPTWTRLQLIAILHLLANQGAPSPPENVVHGGAPGRARPRPLDHHSLLHNV